MELPVSFIRQSWNCYLKDTCEFFPCLDLAKKNSWIGYTLQIGIRFSLRNGFTTILQGDLKVKNVQNRFYFSKTKHFVFQRMITEHMQTPASKCAIPEKIQYSTKLCGTHYLENPRQKTKTDGNSKLFFLDNCWQFHFSF